MGEANEGRRRAMENLSLEMEKYPRDLLQRLMCRSNDATTPLQYTDANEEEESDELELNLGLSLGGRFGVDKSAKNKLIRSTSIAGTMPFVRDDNDATAPTYTAGLMRTSSLPAETEEEWRKRKELQTLRRLEAKRRRSEKQRNSKNEKEGGSVEEEKRELEGSIGPSLGGVRGNRTAGPPFGLPSWVAAAVARQAASGGGVGANAFVKLKGESLSGLQGFGRRPNSQGSSESQGGSSSGMSELESKPLQGTSSCGEGRSPVPSSNQLLQEQSNQDNAMATSGTRTADDASKTPKADIENPSKKPSSQENSEGETRRNTMEDMPCVFTIGDGPNGRKVEGILYRYGKGQEVRIMCVCHGSFLSPAEFVKHAGGSDVTHPLRHIVVNPAAISFL
ncbi:ninja-family protein AFP3-like [Pyrus x bretschneideri]|uniref:ninja-family protein AFP3-like n=1 Tax=Pyrus x bretschneideri TaxID=225117 RepID=UPI00202E9AE2|nr:ninja-family protein AFP3-like [Pyrus x bretschneideri]